MSMCDGENARSTVCSYVVLVSEGAIRKRNTSEIRHIYTSFHL